MPSETSSEASRSLSPSGAVAKNLKSDNGIAPDRLRIAASLPESTGRTCPAAPPTNTLLRKRSGQWVNLARLLLHNLHETVVPTRRTPPVRSCVAVLIVLVLCSWPVEAADLPLAAGAANDGEAALNGRGRAPGDNRRDDGKAGQRGGYCTAGTTWG